MTAADLEFVHLFHPAASEGAPTLLLLHGTGGNEEDLVPVGRMLSADAALLSPRGRVLENGMPRFFRRLAEGVFDLDDLERRTRELSGFVSRAAAAYGFDPASVIAVGFSNGANIAASLLLLEPDVLAGAILFRAMVPIVPPHPPSLAGRSVLMSSGRTDPLIPPAESERLAGLLRQAGADVTLAWQPGGHQLTRQDIALAQSWLAGAVVTRSR